jgi:hypothetical protein
VRNGSRRACDDCRDAIESDDREALLNRAVLIPVPRTLPDRYAPRFRERAKQLHLEFWEQRATVSGGRWTTDQLHGSATPLVSTALRTALPHLMRMSSPYLRASRVAVINTRRPRASTKLIRVRSSVIDAI